MQEFDHYSELLHQDMEVLMHELSDIQLIEQIQKPRMTRLAKN